MQRIEIIGHLAKDAVRVEGQNGGNPFMSFTVICNERRGEDEVKTAYEVAYVVSGVLDFLKKGKAVWVAGYPSARAYQSKEGEPAAPMRISAQSIELL